MRSTRSAKRACISQELVADVKVERFKHSKRSIPAGLAAAQKALVSDATDIGEDSGHIQRPAKKAKALSSKDCVTIVPERERVPTQVAPGPPKGQEQVQAPEPSSTTQLIPTAPSAAPSQQLQQEPFPPLDVDAVQEVQNLLRPGGRRETAACTTLEHCSIPLGREQPYQQLTGIMEACCASGQGACVYVSGLPGAHQ